MYFGIVFFSFNEMQVVQLTVNRNTQNIETIFEIFTKFSSSCVGGKKSEKNIAQETAKSQTYCVEIICKARSNLAIW